jgi:hypothetical protein
MKSSMAKMVRGLMKARDLWTCGDPAAGLWLVSTELASKLVASFITSLLR